jgi:hypothetical protein
MEGGVRWLVGGIENKEDDLGLDDDGDAAAAAAGFLLLPGDEEGVFSLLRLHGTTAAPWDHSRSMGPQPLHASSFFAMNGVSPSTAAPNCVAHSVFSIANPSVN